MALFEVHVVHILLHVLVCIDSLLAIVFMFFLLFVSTVSCYKNTSSTFMKKCIPESVSNHLARYVGV